MVNWKDNLGKLKSDKWRYIVYDDFEGENFSYLRKHYKSLLSASSDPANVSDKYLKKVSINMDYRPAAIILNRFPDWEGCDVPWIMENTVTISINNKIY